MPDDVFEWYDGKLSNVRFTVINPRFTYDSRVGNGEVLVLALEGDYVDNETNEKGEHTETYKCGEGWESANGGTIAKREDGRDKLFNGRTAVVRFINAAIEAGVTKKQILDGGGPTSVEWLKNLEFQMDQVVTDYGGDIGKQSKLLPTKLLSAPKTASNKKKAAPEPTDSAGSSSMPLPALKAKLTTLAKESDTFEVFIDAAFTGPLGEHVNGNVDAEALATDEDFYNAARA